MEYKQLEAYAKEQGYSREELADKIKISYQALGKRINGKVKFDITEIRMIIKVLELTPEQTNFYFKF